MGKPGYECPRSTAPSKPLPAAYPRGIAGYDGPPGGNDYGSRGFGGVDC
jgi:hypothetical protein